ncbi:RNA polymerase, sigma 54 subunit, RpoN/SigL [Desulfocapsa sulfexigens DSM 10523]|uniref:RNA polymerase, sigma 54 subunit, RpoN/SigL n=1 Tax=Desulfocapsa sulfexigens (strain DSM 10523 / SB164P1) TaxID=1167006 RepID=M1P161_DESSD|nr:RNA polymerase factor sigma-54 [Desulfocapsa sulfexigens]AGF77268.1 RNA polymerase, sigma 54 subunit, RpoN/SigL [Desulfocapsa sulfexigens DSM 10523]
MALELRQQLKLSQKLVMTPQLRLAIKLLQMNRLELGDALQAEIEQNPGLEEDVSIQEHRENPQSLSTTTEQKGTEKEQDYTDQVRAEDTIPETNWEDYANTFDSNVSFSHETPAADAPSQFDFISEKPGLLAYLQWQLAHAELEPEEWDTALFIAGNLNRYGFLECSLEEVMEATKCDRDSAEYILEVIQDLDPPGIAARDVSESLFLQLERMGMKDSLAAEIVKDHLNHLQTRNYKAISQATGRKRNEVIKAIEFITSELTPYPGLPYSTETTNYVVPDVYVRKIDGEFVIHLNEEDIPNLKLSSQLQELLQADEGTIEKSSKAYIREKLKDAGWFIKSLHQRQRTIFKVMESILKFQREFFEHGATRLKPLILRDVAEDIEMHESTISRVTSNKYVHTPLGIYELKYFFSTAIPRAGEESLAAESIRERIRKMIQDEDPHKPLSDNSISEKLAERNIEIARRTVAKYREQLKILPVKHRRKPK